MGKLASLQPTRNENAGGAKVSAEETAGEDIRIRIELDAQAVNEEGFC